MAATAGHRAVMKVGRRAPGITRSSPTPSAPRRCGSLGIEVTEDDDVFGQMFSRHHHLLSPRFDRASSRRLSGAAHHGVDGLGRPFAFQIHIVAQYALALHAQPFTYT